MNYKDDEYIVYKHTSPSGKSYIGITHQKPHLRWRSKGQGYKHSTVFYSAIQKNGFHNLNQITLAREAFLFSLIRRCIGGFFLLR